MRSEIKEALKNFFSSRLFVLATLMIAMFSLAILRIFSLQIIQGKSYQDTFTMKIEKPLTTNATRGNIYDRNGNLLAYNVLAYTVTIRDEGLSHKDLNSRLAQVLHALDRFGDELYNDFKIDLTEDGHYRFNVSGTSQKRFLADVFGEAQYSNLGYNDKFGFNEATATADNVMTYLFDQFHLSEERSKTDKAEVFSRDIAYRIVVIRYAMQANRYAQYKSSIIAKDISDEMVAYVHEHAFELDGVEIAEDTIRKYNDSVYFASLIGYTGKIDQEEYDELSQNDSSYTLNDVIGKSGLEQYYESYLRGKNGSKVVYVDNVGRISEVISNTDPVAGNDLYISIDSKLQKAVYLLLEKEIAGIVYSKVNSGDIPIEDVYYALIDNNVIKFERFSGEGTSENEKEVYALFSQDLEKAVAMLNEQLHSADPLANNNMSEEMLDYFTYIVSSLKENKILVTKKIDETDETYKKWKNGRISPKEYFEHAIMMQWIDITKLDVKSQYADTAELYNALCDFIVSDLRTNKKFAKQIYRYMLERNTISGKQLCLILYDQGIVPYDTDAYADLENGRLKPKDFLCDKIQKIEITPAQLALDPCTGSCVVTDVKNGELLALVSYPSFDNNRISNGVDAAYFKGLNEDKSKPQYNYATQERTAPGSTFKMVMATAGMAENVLLVDEHIKCEGKFMEVDNEPRCWSYPRSHASLNVSQAIRDSCNYFFYTVGYKLSTANYTKTYNDPEGISRIQKYATLFGLNEKSGIEIAENKPEIATQYPVMAAIGQSNNNFTTVSLSRYVTAVSTGKLYKYQLMNKIVSPDGNVLGSYKPQYEDLSSVLSQAQWDAIHSGMHMMTENSSAFDELDVSAAGKTGTAQQIESRPNHAHFVGYAPYEDPEISVAVRIAYGYTSYNAAVTASDVMAYYFSENKDEVLEGAGGNVNGSSSVND